MKKVLLILLSIIFLLQINQGFGTWYGKHAVSKGSGKKRCNTDGDTTGGSPSFSRSPWSGSYTSDSRMNSNKNSSYMWCEYWDGKNPESLSVSYTAGWTNSTKTITIQAKDRGGSKLKKMVLQESVNLGSWHTVRTWDNLNAQNTLITKTRNRNVINGNKYKYKLIAYDGAGNSSYTINNNLIKFDTVAPKVNNISSDPSNGTNILATNSKNFKVTAGRDVGAPIVKIQGYFEKSSNCNDGWLNRSTSNSDILSINPSINNVKTSCNFDGHIGGRKYSFRITYVKDEAGNYIGTYNAPNSDGGVKTFKYNIYANSNNLGTFKFDNTSNFTNNKIADGTPYELRAILKDTYGNEIVQAPGINRKIDFNFDITNTLNSDQYNNTGDAVLLTIPNDTTHYSNRLTNSNNFDNQTSGNGEYPFKFKIYAPTNVTNDGDNHSFIINNVKVDINQNDSNPTITNKLNIPLKHDDNITPINNSNPINFKFDPLYTTTFGGSQTNSGFIEGVTQTGGWIKIKKFNNISTSNRNIQLQKYGTAKLNFNGTGAINKTSITNGKIIKKDGALNNFDNFNQNTTTEVKDFFTLFTINPSAPTIEDINNLYVKSWINYKIDITNPNRTLTILYAGDVVGGTSAINSGLKIYGNANIDKNKSRDITTDQDKKDVHNINGRINKAVLAGVIRRKAFNIIRNINIDNSHNNGQEISIGNKYVYYNFSQGNEGGTKIIKINNLNNHIKNKTIIVKGGNLYIKCDGAGTCGTDGNNFPGIIVLKDEKGKGGKLYIDPNVTRLDGAFYIDKSIITYNTSWGEISPNHGGTYSILKNQLFINGSIFSNNTIGGSRKNPPMCPFYLYSVSGFNCNLNEAQKYDLNYLRRGVENKSDSSLLNYPVIIKYNPKLQLHPPALFSK